MMIKAGGFPFHEDHFSGLALGSFAMQGGENRDSAFPATAWTFRKGRHSRGVIRPGCLAIRTNKSGARHTQKSRSLRGQVSKIIVVEKCLHGYEEGHRDQQAHTADER